MRQTVIGVLAALLFASAASAGTIYVDNANSCPGDGSLGNPFCDIAGGMAAALGGDTVEIVDSALYTEALNPPAVSPLTIVGTGGQPQIDGGSTLPAGSTDLTIRNIHLTFSGATAGANLMRFGSNTSNLTLEDNLFDGQDVVGLRGVGGGQLIDNVTVTGNEFKDILNWPVFESSDGGSVMNVAVFSNNNVHDSNGSVTFRGSSTTPTTSVTVENNVWDNIGGNNGNPGDGWGALEVNRADTVVISGNKINDVVVGSFGEGVCFQVWNIPSLDISDNCCTNAAQGVWVALVGPDNTQTGGSINNNSFVNNSEWAVKVNAAAPAGGTLNVENNYWGAADGPSGVGFSGSGGLIIDQNNPGVAAPAVDADPFLTACDPADCAATVGPGECNPPAVPASRPWALVVIVAVLLGGLAFRRMRLA